jgi:hypothetical protein
MPQNQYAFGSGQVFGRRTGVTTPTPVLLGALQECNVDITFSTKELYGMYQFPLAIGRGTAKITGKAKFAQFNAGAFNDLFFGETAVNSGEVVTKVQEAQTPVANYVVVTNNATFAQDLGVVNANTGQVLTRVTTSPPLGTGNYNCNETTGNYGFNSTQNVSYLFSYNYTDTGNGSNIIITNKLLGSAPQFLVVMTETFQANKLTLQLNACMSSKLTMASKLEDFWIHDFDFNAFSDSANVVGKLSLENL